MSPSIADKLVGTWKLVSSEARRSDGNVFYPYGRDAVGRIMYDGQGHFSAQIMGADRPLFASGDPLQGTPEEIKAAFNALIAYFGTYEVDEREDTVMHRVEASWFPNWEGLDQKRFFEVSGNRLTLTTPPILLGGATMTGVLNWERAA